MFWAEMAPKTSKSGQRGPKKGLLLFDFACHPCTGTMVGGLCTVKQKITID